ncbi:MAG: helix-turn-helix domain-containing protein [Desulfotomaculum sp.]|nr:helix-turn-helix domain-containing protein [Desulfotomaculum sp.]MCL0081458.1 helix-turn-helix domain-containing protein [Peptococcaceae bacterium]
MLTEKDKRIGVRIKLLRNMLKLNQSDFSKPLGVDRSHIAGIESGSRNPSEPLLRLIHCNYCVNFTWLKTGTGEMTISAETAIKSQIACFGKQVVSEAINKIIIEHDLTAATTDSTGYCFYTGDKELDQRINTLCVFWHNDDKRLKSWASVQFDHAFPQQIVDNIRNKFKNNNR